MAKIIFALKDNKIVDIDSVENGLACGCKCIACGEDLIARNNGIVREHHFAHHGCEDISECYDKSIISVIEEGFNRSKRILLPSLTVTSGDEHQEIVKNGKQFEYCDVEVLKRKKVESGGYYTLLLLTDKNGNKLEVVVSCGVKNNGEYTNKKLENSRIEFVLDAVEIFNIEDLNKILGEGLLDSKWIYNRKAEEVKRKLLEQKYSTENNYVKDESSLRTRFHQKNSNVRNSSNDRNDDSAIRRELKIRIQDRGIAEKLPQGYCPYCGNRLKIFSDGGYDILQCSICSFRADVDRVKKTVEFRKKFGDKSIVILPIPKMFFE